MEKRVPMEYTEGELTKWLRAELVDLVTNVASVRKSDMPEFNQGLDIICAYDTKVAKILDKLAAPALYEALEQALSWLVTMGVDEDSGQYRGMKEALAKAEGK